MKYEDIIEILNKLDKEIKCTHQEMISLPEDDYIGRMACIGKKVAFNRCKSILIMECE